MAGVEGWAVDVVLPPADLWLISTKCNLRDFRLWAVFSL